MDGESENTEILTLEQGSQYLGIKPHSLFVYVYNGIIPFHQRRFIEKAGKRGCPTVAYTFLKDSLDQPTFNLQVQPVDKIS